jgi:hypothetical protein
MAPPSASPSPGSRGTPRLASVQQRMETLAALLKVKLGVGYEVESETDFGAVIFTPSPRRWLGLRKGLDNQRVAIMIDETGRTHITRVPQHAHKDDS